MVETILMADTVGTDADRIPAGFKAVAGYMTGGLGIVWVSSDWKRFHDFKVRVLQAYTQDPVLYKNADALDCEPGALTITEAAEIARWRDAEHIPTTIYVEASLLADLRAACQNIKGVTYWVANWSLSQAEATALIGGGIVAIQWASPSTNPHTLLPGSVLTLAAANCDLSVASVDWLRSLPLAPHHKKHKRPHPKPVASAIAAAIVTAAEAVLTKHGVHLTGAGQTIVTALAAFAAGTAAPDRKET